MRKFQYNTLAACLVLAIQANAQESQSNATEQASKDETEIIEVQGVRLAELKARDLERGSNKYSNVIATDDLGNFVDQNVAESLRRLPGVTLEREEGEGTKVSIRGLGPNFVNVSMDGGEMAGADDDRAVGLAGITGDSLGSIEVFKTLTPDLNLNSIGGMVNVKSISAFDTGKETLNLKVQNAYQELSDQHSPKFALRGTQFFSDKKIGLGFSASFEERKTHSEEGRQHDTLTMRLRQADLGVVDGSVRTVDAYGDQLLAPSQFEKRLEDATRERTNANLNFEFRPNQDHRLFLRINYSKYTDDDIALREKFDFADAGGIGGGETAYVNASTREFIVTDIDVQNQYFIQEGENVTKTFSLGGNHLLGDATTVDYEYAFSKAETVIPEGRRTQFRERDLIVLGQGSKDMINARVLSPEEAVALSGLDPAVFVGSNNSDVRGDASTLDNFELDNIFLEDSSRIDELKTLKLNITQLFDYEHLSYVKVGGVKTERVHLRDKDRWSFIPQDGDCQGNSACIAVQESPLSAYANAIPETGNFTYPLPTREEVEYITAIAAPLAESATGGNVSFESTRDDYQINEDTYALYAMAELPINDETTLITGVRYMHTEFASTGFLSINNDKFDFGGDSELDISIPLPEAKITYSQYFPSAHLRYEPTEDILVRGALWTSYTRPTFNQARGFAKFDSRITLCNPNDLTECGDDPSDLGNPSAIDLQGYVLGEDNAIKVGNPNLVAMSSVNFDTSIGWYPSEELFMEASFFYKDIDNFIYDAIGLRDSIDSLPLTLPVNQVSAFAIPQDLILNSINITLNGEKATVMGIELSYSQFFDNGFFVQGNATFLDSEAQVDEKIRSDKVALPDQADTTVNFTVGWENEDWSARLITNHRSKILDAVASDATNDRYIDAITTVDMKFKYDVNQQLSLYFDAINLTEEVDLRYVQGNAQSGGNIMFKHEFYGTSYQLGLNYKFY